ncbi:MAG: hypothetical protein DELT_01530 [Desulfovibrio sp.]
MNLVYAKKCIVPTGAANVLQSLNMAAAFSAAGAATYFFPGSKGKSAAERQDVFRTALTDSGISPDMRDTWSLLPGNHAGLYGARFRLALTMLRFLLPDAVFYARDIKEAGFVRRLLSLPGRKQTFVFEMHEVLHLQAQNAHKRDALLREEAAV